MQVPSVTCSTDCDDSRWLCGWVLTFLGLALLSLAPTTTAVLGSVLAFFAPPPVFAYPHQQQRQGTAENSQDASPPLRCYTMQELSASFVGIHGQADCHRLAADIPAAALDAAGFLLGTGLGRAGSLARAVMLRMPLPGALTRVRPIAASNSLRRSSALGTSSSACTLAAMKDCHSRHYFAAERCSD